jgi:hypothetical protein
VGLGGCDDLLLYLRRSCIFCARIDDMRLEEAEKMPRGRSGKMAAEKNKSTAGVLIPTCCASLHDQGDVEIHGQRNQDGKRYHNIMRHIWRVPICCLARRFFDDSDVQLIF